MQTIPICASSEYNVLIGDGLLSDLGALAAAAVTGRTAVIVSDSHVWPLYGEQVCRTLRDGGFAVFDFVIPAGENSKNFENYLKLLNFLAENGLTRSDCLVALGGGVVGDLAGFAAATYLRGIACIQLPTTLLAMVDASVGGKTAIDLPAGKNLVGAFYQPRLVLCDTGTLSTLPAPCFSDGCAEVIKYAMLFDDSLFAQLEREGLDFQQEAVIAQCVTHKRDVVMRDEFDTGHRQMLNLGHTIGHAIEAASHYRISHGRAVAAGMQIITNAAAAHGECSPALCRRLKSLLSAFGLPTGTDLPLEVLMPHILADKKRSGQHITLVIPATTGCALLKTIPVSQLYSYIKAGM